MRYQDKLETWANEQRNLVNLLEQLATDLEREINEKNNALRQELSAIRAVNKYLQTKGQPTPLLGEGETKLKDARKARSQSDSEQADAELKWNQWVDQVTTEFATAAPNGLNPATARRYAQLFRKKLRPSSKRWTPPAPAAPSPAAAPDAPNPASEAQQFATITSDTIMITLRKGVTVTIELPPGMDDKHWAFFRQLIEYNRTGESQQVSVPLPFLGHQGVFNAPGNLTSRDLDLVTAVVANWLDTPDD